MNKTPPAWAKRLAQDLDRGYSREIGLTTKECALLITMHAPDAEALAVALEDCTDMLSEAIDYLPKLMHGGVKRKTENFRSKLTTYRAAHPKPA